MMRFAAAFIVFGLGFTGVSHGAATAIDKQVDQFFSQAMKHCKNAMTLSRASNQVAAAEFDRYESFVGKVEALKPELKNDVMVQRQMEQCEQVGHDIARHQALPVFEKSLAVCKEIKPLLSGEYLTKAKAKFLEYTQYRDQALAMTDTVLQVGSNASKVRRCDRIEEKIIAAEQSVQVSEIKADRLLSTLRKSTDSCLVVNKMLEDAGDNPEKLHAAQAMLSQARSYFDDAQAYPNALARAENYPGYESSKKIRNYLLTYSRCDQNAVATLEIKREMIARQTAAQVPQVASQSKPAATEPVASEGSVATLAAQPVSDQVEPMADATATSQPLTAQSEEPSQAQPVGEDDPYSQGLVQISHEIE